MASWDGLCVDYILRICASALARSVSGGSLMRRDRIAASAAAAAMAGRCRTSDTLGNAERKKSAQAFSGGPCELRGSCCRDVIATVDVFGRGAWAKLQP